MKNAKIVVIGLGYVGLPLALALADKFPDVTGYDVDAKKAEALRRGEDPSRSVEERVLAETKLLITSSEEDIRGGAFYIVAVPTPIGPASVPDLSHLVAASETVGRVMQKGAIVCYESTVYPGVTEDVCGPVLSNVSGLTRGVDFKLGYSPERINPGDRVNRLETIIKIVSGEDEETREALCGVYGAIVTAGLHKAPSIRVAEAAKVIENTQRDINIALMNELSIIFDKMGIPTCDVLEAAGTKWNFIPFSPGLVGGHCIGVDPYYLTYKSEEMGYIPQVILSGRKINDEMGRLVAQKTVKLLCNRKAGMPGNARIGVYGLTFKENISDLRNSKVADIVSELQEYGADVLVHDPWAAPLEAERWYGITLSRREEMRDFDAVILAVPHDFYKEEGLARIVSDLKGGSGVFVDVKSAFRAARNMENLSYWSL